ncbi:phosphoglycolate phosphatase [Martelella mediterranea]|uniref:Phosphoglycolate phosphatase n=1 Tax=Martelella mediterranea TaxID=293089 RepID=A0A4R3P1X6_9HYPH|nr:phosphoglycolate phosphatase [Martelella mediterranea]TCT40874.1 phosphoglycolate phosphatase [Martelella mediterranea]
MSSSLVIFDLDGTLVDTAPDLIESLNHAIAPAGLKPFTIEQLNLLVGKGVRVMIERAFDYHKTTLDEETFNNCFARFTEHYRAGMPGKSRPYPGIVAALERLKATGYDLAVCTNKRENLTMPLLEGLDLTHHFKVITGGDTFPFRKPDPRHVLGTIERANGDAARTVMVGDSSNDIDSAKGAKVAAIAVSFGYADRPPEELGADRLINHYDQLTSALIKELIG